MPRKNEGGKPTKGRGTKADRKAARRAANLEGQGPRHPRRTDRASEGEGKRRAGPRPVRR